VLQTWNLDPGTVHVIHFIFFIQSAVVFLFKPPCLYNPRLANWSISFQRSRNQEIKLLCDLSWNQFKCDLMLTKITQTWLWISWSSCLSKYCISELYQILNRFLNLFWLAYEYDYFDTMRTTVNCFKCYQKFIFIKYWSYEVLTWQRRYTPLSRDDGVIIN